jgi:hypothetical protein
VAVDRDLYASAFLLGMSAYSSKASILPDSMASFQFPVSVHPNSTAFFRMIPTAYPTKSTTRSGSHPKSSQAIPTAPTYSVKSSPAPRASSSAAPIPTCVPV